jgi:hypothetical protein
LKVWAPSSNFVIFGACIIVDIRVLTIHIEIALKITKKNDERKEKTTISRYGLM